MIIFFVVVILGMVSPTYGYFEQYRAYKAYEHGDKACAKKIYDELLTEQPDNAHVAYNLGKMALQDKEFQKAEAYFNHVTAADEVPSALQEQAWYDKGLSYVYRQQWQEALTSFQEVLKINPDNEYAKKMIEQIQKKLEEEKKQQEQQQDQQKNEESSDQSHDDNENDSNKDEHNDAQSDKNEQSDEKNHENKKSDEQNQTTKDDAKDKKSDEASSEQNKKNESEKNERDARNNEKEQENQQEQGQDTESSKPNQQEQQPSSAQPAEQHKELPDAKKAGTYGNQKPPDKELQLLELVEKHDAQASKALFKRHVQQCMAGHYGQKNW